MPIKELICLACSRRPGGRCFAGLDEQTRSWIRPISSTDEGGLTFGQYSLPGGTEPKILDVIAVDLVRPLPTIGQPENWLVGPQQWRRLRHANSADMEILRSRLFDDPELFRNYERKVSHAEIQSRPPDSSLALVRPVNLAWHATPRPRYPDEKRIEGSFEISGAPYQLVLTDPIWEQRLSGIPMHCHVKHGDRATIQTEILLTLSLGEREPNWGNHHKLIAGVVEVPTAREGARW